jgi:hypothetical protein
MSRREHVWTPEVCNFASRSQNAYAHVAQKIGPNDKFHLLISTFFPEGAAVTAWNNALVAEGLAEIVDPAAATASGSTRGADLIEKGNELLKKHHLDKHQLATDDFKLVLGLVKEGKDNRRDTRVLCTKAQHRVFKKLGHHFVVEAE